MFGTQNNIIKSTKGNESDSPHKSKAAKKTSEKQKETSQEVVQNHVKSSKTNTCKQGKAPTEKNSKKSKKKQQELARSNGADAAAADFFTFFNKGAISNEQSTTVNAQVTSQLQNLVKEQQPSTVNNPAYSQSSSSNSNQPENLNVPSNPIPVFEMTNKGSSSAVQILHTSDVSCKTPQFPLQILQGESSAFNIPEKNTPFSATNSYPSSTHYFQHTTPVQLPATQTTTIENAENVSTPTLPGGSPVSQQAFESIHKQIKPLRPTPTYGQQQNSFIHHQSMRSCQDDPILPDALPQLTSLKTMTASRRSLFDPSETSLTSTAAAITASMQVDEDSFSGVPDSLGADVTGVDDDTSDIMPISGDCNNCLILKRKLEEVEGENKRLKQVGPPGKNKLSFICK